MEGLCHYHQSGHCKWGSTCRKHHVYELCSTQGDQKGNLESDYFTLRNWAHNF